MTDILESAKEQLHNNNFSIVIVGENDVYTSTKHGVAPLLEILDGGDDVIKNSFVADKVVGKRRGKRGLCRYYKLSCT